MTDLIASLDDSKFVYHVLRYTSNLIRDEWVNIGVILFDPLIGALRLRLAEEQDEYTRIRRLQPRADEDVLRGFRDHLEDRFATFLRNRQSEQGGTLAVGEELQKFSRVGAPGSRAMIRSYCSQVWKTAGLWERIRKSVRVAEFTFPGDPMRIDYSYRRNGTRGYVQTLSVSRAPADCKLYAYTAARIAARAPFASEFAAVTDVTLLPENERHRFVRDTLRDAGIEPVGVDHFATWVPKLKPTIQ
jgi:Protein of unknown function (DUF3037)